MKHRIGRATAAAAAVLLLGSACGPGATQPDPAGHPLVFITTPSGGPIALQHFQPVIDMLRKETGREIRIQDATDYDTFIEATRTGAVDIAAFSPLTYVVAKHRNAKFTVVAAQTREKGSKPGYQGYGITLASSPIQGIGDLRGKKVCYVDRNSASGYLYPAAAMMRVGIRPEEDTTPIFARNHEAAVLSVVNKQCDAGFVFDEMVERDLIQRGQIQSGQLVRVWTSELIPGAPIGISDTLPEDLRERLTKVIEEKANADSLRADGFCQGECPLGNANAYGYTKVDDAFYDGVREVCRIARPGSC
jgi:phosphonate transport system substrate-binding protein